MAAEILDGFVVYPGAFRGARSLHRPTIEGTEDYVRLESAGVPELKYDVTLGDDVAGLRLVANVLEFVDKDNDRRLRVASPYIVGADGKRTEATLSVSGCITDTNPAAPWERRPTNPGARACVVRVAWNHAVAYPAVLDPQPGQRRGRCRYLARTTALRL